MCSCRCCDCQNPNNNRPEPPPPDLGAAFWLAFLTAFLLLGGTLMSPDTLQLAPTDIKNSDRIQAAR